MLLSSGCVLPLGPEFQDPPTEKNVAPEIVSTDPPQGSPITVTDTDQHLFEVTAQDANGSDDLTFRWIGDYPPQGPNSRLLTVPDPVAKHLANGQSVVGTSSIPIQCLNFTHTTQPHVITVVVSDRGFDDSSGQIAQPKTGGKTAEVNWFVTFTAQRCLQ